MAMRDPIPEMMSGIRFLLDLDPQNLHPCSGYHRYPSREGVVDEALKSTWFKVKKWLRKVTISD
eukprot:scaffold149229_cov60-Attheya_sp.AAC.1